MSDSDLIHARNMAEYHIERREFEASPCRSNSALMGKITGTAGTLGLLIASPIVSAKLGASLASILTASLLLQLGVKQVWAKANSASHGRILTQIGVHHVIFPEYEMGRRVAHQVSGESLDYVHIDEDFVMVKAICPATFAGQSLAQLKIRGTYGVTVVAYSHAGEPYQPAFPETVLNDGDLLVVAGRKKPLDEFCQLD